MCGQKDAVEPAKEFRFSARFSFKEQSWTLGQNSSCRTQPEHIERQSLTANDSGLPSFAPTLIQAAGQTFKHSLEVVSGGT